MAGTNGGTGEPYWFRCAKGRRWDSLRWGDRPRHVCTPTGKSRDLTDVLRHGKHGFLRHGRVAYEYRCSCGHVGWSRHKDLAAMATRKKGETP